LGRGRYVVGESVGGLHHAVGGGHTLHDLGGDVVALGVTLYRNGDELSSCGGGRDASVLAGKGDHTGGEIGFGGGAVHLPGPVHRKSELPGQELFPHRVLGVVEHRVGCVSLIHPSLQQFQGFERLGRIQFTQVRAGAPEPGQELERTFFRSDRGEGDTAVVGVGDLFQGVGERGPVGDLCGIDPGLLQDRLVVVDRKRVGTDRDSVGFSVDHPGGQEVLVDVGGVEAELVHGGEHLGLGQGGDRGVVQQDDVGGCAFLGGEQGLVG